MKQWFYVAILVLGLSVIGSAQSPTKYFWDQDAPSLSAAQGYNYRMYLDGATSFTSALVPTCSGTTTPYSCSAPLNLTAGTHTVQITAGNNIGESPKSTAITVTVSAPSAPANVRVQ